MLEGVDPKVLASMGLDAKSLSAALDPKNIPKSMAGMDPKAMAAMGMDPKTLASFGLDAKALAGMGFDAKTLQMMGLDPKTGR